CARGYTSFYDYW
nr:immunoglobulin heavy chain junction region [Macaca mulatta]MOW47544.1 immunoglobulin heavy chain junction region [Macaca mulatta]